MPRRLTPEKQLELDRLTRTLSVIASWADPLIGSSPQDASILQTVKRASDEKNLAGLRMMLNDLVTVIQAATPAQRHDLDVQLRSGADCSLSSLMQKQFAQIERILKRGELTSEQQYYLVREHVELIADDPEHVQDLPRLLAMLDAYELVAAKRARA